MVATTGQGMFFISPENLDHNANNTRHRHYNLHGRHYEIQLKPSNTSTVPSYCKNISTSLISYLALKGYCQQRYPTRAQENQRLLTVAKPLSSPTSRE